MRGLVLSGAGGAIGFLGGALEVFERSGTEFHVITGTSSGAIVGIMKATDQTGLLKSILLSIEDKDVAKKRTFRYARRFLTHLIGVQKPMNGVYDNTPLRKLLRTHLIGKKVQIDFSSIVYCIDTREVEYFTFTKGTIFDRGNIDLVVSKIIASTAIPGVFAPEIINGKRYVDGGAKTHTPIEPLKKLMPLAEHITIISTAGEHREAPGTGKSDLDVVTEVSTELIGMVAEMDFLKFEYKNKLSKCYDEYKYYPSTIIKPTQKLAPTIRFHYSYTKPDWLHGKEMALGCLWPERVTN